MVQEVTIILHELGAWAEDCPCHSNYWEVRNKKQKHNAAEVGRRFKKLIKETQGIFETIFAKLIENDHWRVSGIYP